VPGNARAEKGGETRLNPTESATEMKPPRSRGQGETVG